MPSERILILAGTTEARDLANALVAQGRDVISSFAGVTTSPLLPAGEIHVGGFGGVKGLREFVEARHITKLVDATHPFAAQMSAHAHAAAQLLGLTFLRLERPAWEKQAGDRWIDVSNISVAASAVPAKARVFVTTGRKALQQFFDRRDLAGMIRTIEPPNDPLPVAWSLLQDRPPYDEESERALMLERGITCLVTKNAGGASTYAKILAARTLALPVVMIARPGKPNCTTVPTSDAALAALKD